MQALPAPLVPMAAREQFVTWYARPKPDKPGKFDKIPCDWRTGEACNAHDPDNWCSAAVALCVGPGHDRGHGSGAGFVFTADDPFFFLDIDNCLQPDGTRSALAVELCRRFAGAAVEVSHSGRGLHVFGQYAGPAPLHGTRNTPAGLELYTSGRFVALTGDGAEGDASHPCDAPLAEVVAAWFPPSAVQATPGEWTTEPCPEWNGPSDDDELIRRARAAAARSPNGVFGGGRTFTTLWDGGPGNSEDDAALASHLAWWTGGDCERMERLMRQSTMYRDKWETHRPEGTYLTKTVLAACAVVTGCYTGAAGLKNADGPSPALPSRLKLLSPSDCAVAPSRGYIVKGIMAPGDIGCIFGAPGAGKSLIGPHLAYAVAQNRDVFGLRTKPGKTFYVAAEDPHGMGDRVKALNIAHGDAPGFFLVEGVSDLFSEGGDDLGDLLNYVETHRPTLIFIDTLAMAFHGLDENDSRSMNRVVAVARSLAKFGAAVVLIHHDTKAEGSTPRGHSVLNGALDFAIYIKRDVNGIVRGKLTKNRNGSCDRDIAFRIDTRSLGTDEDGDQITAALVVELPRGAMKRAPELPDAAKAAIEQLRCMLADKARHSPDMSGSVRVPVAEWRHACVEGRTVSGSENQGSRQKAFTRALENLDRAGSVSITDEGVCEIKTVPPGSFDELPDTQDRQGQSSDMSGSS